MSPSHAWRPTAEQNLLLQALLHPDDDRAAAAIRGWQSCVDIETLDFGSYRLLPLLWKRIGSQGWDLPERDLIKGVYRRTWYANHLQLSRLAEITKRLQEVNCASIWLKGAALIVQCYDDLGVRPMDDVDLLVQPGQARIAINSIVDAGWNPSPTPLTVSRTSNPRNLALWIQSSRPRSMFDEAYFSARHGHGFSKENACNLDLHWRLMQEFEKPLLEENCWSDPDRGKWRNAEILLPNPVCHLLFLLLHGCRWNPTPAIRWVADAMTLIRSQGERLDWVRFHEFACAGNVCQVLYPMLSYLHQDLDAPIPQDCLIALKNQVSSRKSKRCWDILQRPPKLSAALLELALLRSRFRQHRQALGAKAQPGSFPAYVRHCLGAPDMSSLASFAVKELICRAVARNAVNTTGSKNSDEPRS